MQALKELPSNVGLNLVIDGIRTTRRVRSSHMFVGTVIGREGANHGSIGMASEEASIHGIIPSG